MCGRSHETPGGLQGFSSGGFNRAWSRLAGNRWPLSDPVSAKSVYIRHWSIEILYVAKFAEAVYVLHAFEKRTRRTPQRDVGLARQRFHELLALRRAGKVSGG
jgi:hypothetical protein